MRKARLKLCLASVIPITSLILWMVLMLPGINARNSLRLYRGITDQRTEQILGSPGNLLPEAATEDCYVKTWEAGQITIVAQFSYDDKRMIAAALHRKFSNHEEQVPLCQLPFGYKLTFTEKIAIWLGLPAH